MEVIMKNQNFIKPSIKLETINLNTNKYLIDTLIADVYLSNNEEGTSSINLRPIIYLALDIHSKLIAGIYVDTLKDQFFNGVKKVINNCIEDKTEFCKKYNIEITNEWPLIGVPHTILLDIEEDNNHELLRRIVEELHIAVEYDRYLLTKTNGYTERIFNKINNKAKHQLENRIDIYDFTRMVINTVTEHNKNIIDKYHQS